MQIDLANETLIIELYNNLVYLLAITVVLNIYILVQLVEKTIVLLYIVEIVVVKVKETYL